MKYLLILFLAFTACKKPADRTCWKFTGKDSEKLVNLYGYFSELEINTYLAIDLIQDSLNYLKISGGENVINEVKVELIDGKLTLTNTNKCKFLRSPKHKIKVEVHFSQLDKVIFLGSENINSVGKIVQSNFNLEVRESSGTVNLELQVDDCQLDIEPCFADYTIRGTAKTARFSVKGSGYCNTTNFVVSDKIVCVSRSSSDLYINGATHYLKCETTDLGNVYYLGTPAEIKWNDYGKGKLLQAP
ncbi:MAG: DUF2807 domain-containing protein [Crocinitomicaceae bacterium]